MNALCFAGHGCMGCSMCEENCTKDEAKEDNQRKEDKLRAEGKPTLFVPLGDILFK